MASTTSPLHPRSSSAASAGTTAVVIFIAGAIILVLVIILILLFFKKRRASHKQAAFIPRLERQRGARYGKLEDDEEGAWSSEMGGHEEGKGGYAPVHHEGLAYQSQTVRGGEEGMKDVYR